MAPRPREVVLAAQASFYQLERTQSGHYNKVPLRSLEASRGEVERDIKRVIELDLPAELQEIYGLRVRARFITTRPGSIIAFFGVVVGALGAFASYSDFFESISLVRKHSASLITRLLEERYTPGPSLTSDVSVTIEYPRMPDPDDLNHSRWLRKRLGPESESFFTTGWMNSRSRVQHDGLFWWLIICNIVLAVALSVLVAAAVAKTYFPRVYEPVPGQTDKGGIVPGSDETLSTDTFSTDLTTNFPSNSGSGQN